MSQHQLRTNRILRGPATVILVLLIACFATLVAQDKQGQEVKKKTAPPANNTKSAPPPRGQQAAKSSPVTHPNPPAQAPPQGQQATTPNPIHRPNPPAQTVPQGQQTTPPNPVHRPNPPAQTLPQGQQTTPPNPINRPNPPAQTVPQGQQTTKSIPNPPNRPLPAGPGGQPGPRMTRTPNGGEIHRNADGRVTQVRTPNGAVIQRAPTGERRVEVARPGNRVVVTTAPGHGYVQHPIVFANSTYVQRTYVAHGAMSVRVYRPVMYRGVQLDVYTPVRYYRPSFYTYAYNPWPRPVYYSWGWVGTPWFDFYGGYFAPYPVYASPSLWLTDYLIATTLQAAYQERIDAELAAQAGNYPASSQPVLTPEVKQLVADEVRRQLDLESAEQQSMGSNTMAGSSDVPPMFADNAPHVLVVSRSLAVYDADLRECTISEGDVIQLIAAPAADPSAANVIVLASQPQSCRRGSTVSVQLADLQEMQNNMQATIDQGLQELQAQGGQGGLPMPPPASTGTVNAPFASQVQADPAVTAELNQAAQDAGRAEQDVVNQSAAPTTISLGQTIADVVAILGQPQQIVDLGSKKIYVYKNLKITFVDGRVTDVQ